MKEVKYLLQQPQALESLAIEKLGDWIAARADNIMQPVAEIYQHNTTEAEDLLSQQIDIIRNHIEGKVPGVLHNAIAVEVARALEELLGELFDEIMLERFLDRRSSTAQLGVFTPDCRMKVVGRMIETVFTKHLTCLSLDYRKLKHIEFFLPSLLTKSYLLSNLIQLDLVLIDLIDVTEILKHLHKLICLTLNDFLDIHKTFRCIVENCMLIESLQLFVCDEYVCYYVLFKDILSIFTRLANLRSFGIRGNIQECAIEKLLSSCQNIEYIVIKIHSGRSLYNTRKDEIACALNRCWRWKRFKLKNYETVKNTSLKHLQLVVEKCPQIEKITMESSSVETSLFSLESVGEILHKLQNLRELQLFNYDFYDQQVMKLLQFVGSNLATLFFDNVWQIDLNALMYIGNLCPNLEFLHADFSDFGTFKSEVFDVEMFQLKKPLFLNLKKLFFCGSQKLNYFTSCQVALLLLSNCLNIEYITIESNILDNDIMLKVLDKNPMTQLEVLRLSSSSYSNLSMLVIDRLIQSCINPPVVLTGNFNNELYDCLNEIR